MCRPFTSLQTKSPKALFHLNIRGETDWSLSSDAILAPMYVNIFDDYEFILGLEAYFMVYLEGV